MGKMMIAGIVGVMILLAGCSSVISDFTRLQDIGKDNCKERGMVFKGLYSASGEIYSICNTNSPYKEYSFQVT